MNDRRPDGQVPPQTGGLCDSCAHVRLITSAKGSRFYLCNKSLTDPAFPKYPGIPVLSCAGYLPSGTPLRPPRP